MNSSSNDFAWMNTLLWMIFIVQSYQMEMSTRAVWWTLSLESLPVRERPLLSYQQFVQRDPQLTARSRRRLLPIRHWDRDRNRSCARVAQRSARQLQLGQTGARHAPSSLPLARAARAVAGSATGTPTATTTALNRWGCRHRRRRRG